MTTARKPAAALSSGFLKMLDDFAEYDPQNGHFYAPARDDFAAYVRELLDEEHGENLPPGYVPCSHRWVVDEKGNVVGVVRVRHDISTPFLADEAGHIGYDVAPSLRRRGYGSACLRAGLERAREVGLKQVLLFADANNPASWRTIERCGGVLEAERYSDHYQCLVRRYRIDVPLA